jgi:nicotinamide-nucleotide amidase
VAVAQCTGGLGPTRDDLTRDAVARLYGRKQHVDDGWMDVLRERYARRGIPMPDVNRVQALLPDGAELLRNANGTAPGIAIEDETLGLTVLMPGVPSEMRGMMETHVVPLLQRRLGTARPIRTRMIRTAGISEAALAEQIDDIARDLAPLSLAFLPQVASVDLRLTCGAGVDDAETVLDRAAGRLKQRLGDAVYADDDTDLAVAVGRTLAADGLTLALAESCTGGLVAKRLTDAPGASEFLLAGFVTYHNDAKRAFVGVRSETLAMHGAVSEQCAREMAEGARTAIGADVAVAITGIAGPGGGSDDKPVGTVWYAVALAPELADRFGHDETVLTRRFVHPGDRSDIRDRAAQTALDMLRRALRPATVA